MNIRYFILAIVVTISLNTVSEAMADNSAQFTQNKIILSSLTSRMVLAKTQTVKGISRTSQHQETRITIDASRLDEPHSLVIRAEGTAQLSGNIAVDGVIVRRLTGREVRLELSPYLSIGTQTIDIEGTYRPINRSVQITLIGPNSNIVQQTSGTGILNHKLVLTAE